jgi:hypothetical protein
MEQQHLISDLSVHRITVHRLGEHKRRSASDDALQLVDYMSGMMSVIMIRLYLQLEIRYGMISLNRIFAADYEDLPILSVVMTRTHPHLC